MTTDDQVRLAHVGARYAARRDNGRSDPGEWLGAAWERVSRELARNPALPASHAVSRAKQAAFDAVRVDRGWRAAAASTRPALFSELAADALSAVPARPDRDSPECRLLALWCSFRPLRLRADIRARLWAFLMRVEGWTLAEVAALWGCHPNWIHKTVAAAGLVASRFHHTQESGK